MRVIYRIYKDGESPHTDLGVKQTLACLANARIINAVTVGRITVIGRYTTNKERLKKIAKDRVKYENSKVPKAEKL